MNKLIKECPFCGNTKAFIETDEIIQGLDEGSGYFAVVCSVNHLGCGATSGFAETREGALEKWNRRI